MACLFAPKKKGAIFMLGVSYFQMPKFFFTEPKYRCLSNDAKLLYGFMRDRLNLSIMNSQKEKGKWEDERGTFILMARKSIAEFLHRSLPTVRKVVRELIAVGLLIERRMGLTFCNRLYVQLMDGENVVPFFGENKLPLTGNQAFPTEGKPVTPNNPDLIDLKNKGYVPGKMVDKNEVYGKEGRKNSRKYPTGTVPAQQYRQREYSGEFWAELYQSWDEDIRNFKE